MAAMAQQHLRLASRSRVNAISQLSACHSSHRAFIIRALIHNSATMMDRGEVGNRYSQAESYISVSLPPGLAHDIPGINCPLTKGPRHPAYPPTEEDDLYPTALHGDAGNDPATTLRELKWQGMMNEITDKPDWQNKILSDEIQKKWKQEALEYGRSVPEGFSERMADKMIDELKTKALHHESSKLVVAIDPGVVKSDKAVPESLKQELLAAARPLESVPESAKDWHPGSNNQVLDLVHPSLYPLIYGQTRILPTRLGHNEDPLAHIGSGWRLPALPPQHYNQWQYSATFQWLPAEIRFDENKQAKFTSYINNLHPHTHKKLYSIIEKVIDAAIPLWSRTLSSWPVQQRITYDQITYYPYKESPRLANESHSDYEKRAFSSWPVQPRITYYEVTDYVWKRFPRLENESDRDHKWRIDNEYQKVIADHVVQPEPHDKEIIYNTSDIKEKFHAGLQVIVKLANIELKPGESYAGGSWHVEGQANEAIVATALYYYSNENISDSRLAFRQTTDPDEFKYDSLQHPNMEPEQNEDDFLGPVYGTSNFTSTVQELGSVQCRDGRLITFPNTLQHRVLPFELKDKTRPGHRKILALFLVDPHLRVVSTATVPPQQPDWGTNDIDAMPLEEAKEWRLKLMEERKRYVHEQDCSFNEYQYSLCEH